MERALLGQLLQKDGLIDEFQLLSALGYQRKWGVRLGEALLRLRLIQQEQLLGALGRQLGVAVVRIGERTVPPQVLRLLPEKLIRRRRAFPLHVLAARPARLVVAFAAPEDLHVRDEVSFAAGMRIVPVLASSEDIDEAIARHLGARPPFASTGS